MSDGIIFDQEADEDEVFEAQPVKRPEDIALWVVIKIVVFLIAVQALSTGMEWMMSDNPVEQGDGRDVFLFGLLALYGLLYFRPKR